MFGSLPGGNSPIWQIGHAALILISTIQAMCGGLRSPNENPVKDRQAESPIVHVFIIVTEGARISAGVITAVHIIRVVVFFFDSRVYGDICSMQQPPLYLISLGITGALLILTGNAIRVYCYKVLGQYFTFHLAIKKDQTLITEGPYHYVRHPSYLGSFIMTAGFVLAHILCHPYAMCRGWILSSGPYLEVSALIALCTLIIISLTIRMKDEDRMMKEKFGKEYIDWALKTYRLIPYVY